MIELVPPGTHIDFIGKSRITVALSVTLLLAGLVAALTVGPKWGIDFAGGTEIQIAFPETPDAQEGPIREIASQCGIQDPSVIRYGRSEPPEFLIKFRGTEQGTLAEDSVCPVRPEQRAELAAIAESVDAEEGEQNQAEIVERLRMAIGNAVGPVEVLRVDFVGPRVGAELRADGLRAILGACVLILAYIGVRFSVRYAPGAVIALIHDVGITAGIFVLFGLEFDLRVLAALLAIIGYSLNDTIVIYDRIRENLQLHTKAELPEVLNRSVNQTLSRTVLTSGTTLAALLSLLFVGGAVIWPFALAMTIGVVVGTYSSVFIAAPTLLFLERQLGGEQAQPRKGGSKRTPRAASL